MVHHGKKKLASPSSSHVLKLTQKEWPDVQKSKWQRFNLDTVVDLYWVWPIKIYNSFSILMSSLVILLASISFNDKVVMTCQNLKIFLHFLPSNSPLNLKVKNKRLRIISITFHFLTKIKRSLCSLSVCCTFFCNYKFRIHVSLQTHLNSSLFCRFKANRSGLSKAFLLTLDF